VTDGMAVMSLSASLIEKISAAADHLWQITLKWKLLYKFEKRCKFLSHIKTKLCKLRPDCSECYSGLKLWTWHHERWSLISGQNLQRKHRDPVTKHESFFLLVTISVYNKPESQICAKLQPRRMQQKILSHTTELTCPHKTWLHFGPACF
jgi:hypothetical protein